MIGQPTIPRLSFPPELPISAHADALTALLREKQVVIVCGDTGSGKTTQLPKIALAAGRGRRGLVGCTQPRRLAALAMARRVAEELGGEVGGFVGCQHRFEKSVSKDTRVKFMTDGILLAETRSDPLFRAYDTLIIDEAHERSLNIDFLLGIIKRLLPKRPDLRVVISSATLDAEKFSAFFDNAPVVAIPGRLHPIELRWRPCEEDEEDLPRRAADAVDELMQSGDGDMLVFLSGERDIRDTQEVLKGRNLPRTEIIPLLASLSAGEQQRAFRTGPNRRIILSTNVAETSLTLPGIRYVIDTGVARIKRYNPRTQVQRLQVEPISQASAKQRMGRCGRLGPGICIRLYGEDDFAKRDAHTAPEITRSALAAVILSLLDLRLGDIESFPFIDPPSGAMVREGYRALLELGAIEPAPRKPDAGPADVPSVRLTSVGRQLAHLPLEPHVARMILAAEREGNLRDTLTVVAALACDDPRNRPMAKQDEADIKHRPFLRGTSDFSGLLALWSWYDAETKGGSQTVARRLCKTHFLSYPRMRDWIDLRGQLEKMARGMELAVESAAGGEAALHRALLAGLLGRIGRRDPETGDYRGGRGVVFSLFPGSGLLKVKPKRLQPGERPPRRMPEDLPTSRDWIMAAELVETSRLFARTVACIDPDWIEPIARHLCKYHHHSPWWDADLGFARVRERVTLNGLVLAENRVRDYTRINPAEARALFIREGLVQGLLAKPPVFLKPNLDRTAALREIEEKTRRHGELLDEERLYAHYDAALPPTIACLRDLVDWFNRAAPDARERLLLTDADFPVPDAESHDFPDQVVLGGKTFPLAYRHAPGEEDDGVTCTVPADRLRLLAGWRHDWLVPGLIDDKLRGMLDVLPTKLRRLLIPTVDTLAACRPRLKPTEPLAVAFARAIEATRSVRIDPNEFWNEDNLPDHLRMRFRVLDPAGKELGKGRNLDLLVRLFASAPQPASPAAAPAKGTSWIFGTLPEQIETGHAGWAIVRYPALVDETDGVAVRDFADAGEASQHHVKGLCSLFAFALGKSWKSATHAPSLSKPVLAFLKSAEIDPESLGKEIAGLTLRDLFIEEQPPIRDAATFDQRLKACGGLAQQRLTEWTRLIVAILHETAQLEQTVEKTTGVLPRTIDDLLDQLAWLVFPGFIATVPTATLRLYPRYLEAARLRLERARGNPGGDIRKLDELAPHWQRYRQLAECAPKPRHNPVKLADYRWLVEAYRISLFAQELRSPIPVSAKRLDTLWQEILA